MLIFDFSTYRDFLKAKIYQKGRAQRGALSALAAAIPCQTSYLSRVMSGAADLSLEQADSVAHYFGLSPDETYFFLMLVQLARAGTASLRTQFQKVIDQAREDRLNLQKRVGVKDSISKEDQATYYSHWYFAALHVMTGIPSMQTKQAMAKELNLPLSRISEILDFLVSIGLVNEGSDGRYSTGIGKIHLKKDSPMILRHHANWRIQAIRCIEKSPDAGIHYSVLVNTSKSDSELLRSMIAQFIEKFMKVVHPSVDEEMNCFTLDFFKPEA